MIKNSYTNLLKSFEFNEAEAIRSIEKNRNIDIKTKLINDAKTYYAYIYNCEPDEVKFGDLDLRIPNPSFLKGICPYTVIVGDIKNFGRLKTYDMSKLKAVHGSINASFSNVNTYTNLQYVRDNANFSGVKGLNLPSLRRCDGAFIADGASIVDLPLKYAKIIHLNGSDIDKVYIKACYILDLTGCKKVKDLSILESANYLYVKDTNIEKINDNLKVTDTLYCENSNNFEKKLKPGYCKRVINEELTK